LSKENEIVNLNIKQIENSTGNDGKLLENNNKRFTGLYSLATQMLNPRKTNPIHSEIQVTFKITLIVH
jgi:hypothetical protein